MTILDDRTELEILERATCFELLRSESVGRIAFSDGQETSILPVNYLFDENRVVFRTAGGVKLSAAVERLEVAFEIDGIDAEARTGWSVVVHGALMTVSESDEIEHLRALGLRPWARAHKENWLAVHPRRISGRRIITIAEEGKVGPDSRIKTAPGSVSTPEVAPAADDGVRGP